MTGNPETREHSIIENIQDGYCEIDLAGTFTYVNAAACEIFGYSREEIIGLNYRQYTDKPNAQKAFTVFNRIYRTGVSEKLYDYELTGKDGARRQVELSASLIVDEEGNPTGFRGTARDVTESKQMEERLRRSEERYRTIIEDMGDAYFEIDLAGKLIFANDALCRILGYPREELIGMYSRQYAAEKTIRGITAVLSSIYKTGAPVRAHVFELIPKHGGRIHTEISLSLIKDKEGRPAGFRGIARDITERREYERQIHHLATHDILTGLPNRFLFLEMLQQSIEVAGRSKQQFALLFVDLDGFKYVNDTFGHEAGDQLLILYASRLRQALRASDYVARLGGDEFVILVREVSSTKNLVTLVKKILEAVREPVTLGGRELFFTASIGISVFPQDGRDKETLMKTADIAMYSSKEKGSSNYQFYSKGIKSHFKEKSMLEEHLPRALERGELFLHYQPQLDLKTGLIAGVEALLRWRNPDLGLVAPKQLIPAAEGAGLLVPIGAWALKTACLQNVAWQRRGLPRIGMAVNLSHRQLMDEGLIADIKAALKDSGMEPALLELEISENLLMTYFPYIINVLSRLKGLGVRLALDDYGAGYSSLAQIRHLPVDSLKIDGSIVSKVPASRVDAALVKAIIGIGRALDMTIVAEGVETPEQVAFLKGSSCDLMQGFHYSRPLAPERISDLLGKNEAPPGGAD